MVRWDRLLLVALVGAFAPVLPACEPECDQEVIDRAEKFIASNQSCTTDADCVVIDDFCEQLAGGYCGQLPLSRAGAESAEWKALEAELRDCAPDKCAVCLALLLPSCQNGSCGGGD
jgi:hypothetical protein